MQWQSGFENSLEGLLALCVGVGAHVAFAAEFYVSPTAAAGRQRKLQQSLDAADGPGSSGRRAIRATPSGCGAASTTAAPFTSHLEGTSASPIIVRQYPGERARIDGNYNGNEVTLDIQGSYTWYWGFEVFNSDPTRYSSARRRRRRGAARASSWRATERA